MSLITEYRATEEAIKELQEKLEKLTENESLYKEMEFEEKLRTLMAEYGKSLRDVIEMIDPEYRKQPSIQPGKARAQRAVKIYRNPETGEFVETKGGNHRMLKEWKMKHGADVVEAWRTQ